MLTIKKKKGKEGKEKNTYWIMLHKPTEGHEKKNHIKHKNHNLSLRKKQRKYASFIPVYYITSLHENMFTA